MTRVDRAPDSAFGMKLFRKCMTPRGLVVTAELHWIDNLFDSVQRVVAEPRPGGATKLAVTRTGPRRSGIGQTFATRHPRVGPVCPIPLFF